MNSGVVLGSSTLPLGCDGGAHPPDSGSDPGGARLEPGGAVDCGWVVQLQGPWLDPLTWVYDRATLLPRDRTHSDPFFGRT